MPPLPIMWALSDIVGAWALLRIWRARQRVGRDSGSREGLVTAAFLLNPYLFLPSLALSTSTFENAAVLLTLMFASEGKSNHLSEDMRSLRYAPQGSHRQPSWLSHSQPISPSPPFFYSSLS